MPATTHPECGKTYPANNTHGHCGGCCETFVGLASFDAHRHGPADNRWCKILPYDMGENMHGEPIYGHWQDERGYWKHGKQLTQEEKDRIFGGRS